MDSPAHQEKLSLDARRVEWREVDGEIIALDLKASMYLAVSRTGAVAWTALAAGTTRAEILTRVLDRFRVAEEEAGRDLDNFLAELGDRGLLLREVS